MLRHFQKAFSLDKRSLGLMRILYGLLILIDLSVRSYSFDQHYTEEGAFPLAAAFSMGIRADQFSLHTLSGSRDYLILLFLIHAVIAMLLLLGWRTRLMTVLCYIMAVSLQNRNFLILNGGDNWMRIVLFWAMFLPWGDRFSLDSRPEKEGAEADRVFSVATCGLLVQVMLVYFVSALYKTGPAWRTEGSAAYLALNQLEWNSDLGLQLLYYPKFLVWSTFGLLALELCGPWLLVCPVWSEPLRVFAVVGFFVFHGMLGLCMELGVFPLVGMFTVLGLLPAWPWESRPGRVLQRRLDGLFATATWNTRLRASAGSSRPLSRGWASWPLVAILVLTLYWNAAGKDGTWLPLPNIVQEPAYLLGLNQYWGLFAPEPGRRAGWYVFEGLLSDGDRVRLPDGGPLDWTEPASGSVYPTQRVKRWWVSTSLDDYQLVRPYIARWLFSDWDRRHANYDAKLIRVRAHYLSRETLLDFEDPGLPVDKVYIDLTREQVGLP